MKKIKKGFILASAVFGHFKQHSSSETPTPPEIRCRFSQPFNPVSKAYKAFDGLGVAISVEAKP